MAQLSELIIFESVAVAAVITHIVRASTRRPRPFLYLDDAYPERRSGPDATQSFWSGHVAYTVAFGVSAAYLFTLRHGLRAPSTWIMWAAMLGLGATTATLQVFAGDHFVSDTLVGAGVGAGIGLLVPLMHPRNAPPRVTITPTVTRDFSGLSVSGRL
jgi:membrane-associated phospholipid phosphatase